MATSRPAEREPPGTGPGSSVSGQRPDPLPRLLSSWPGICGWCLEAGPGTPHHRPGVNTHSPRYQAFLLAFELLYLPLVLPSPGYIFPRPLRPLTHMLGSAAMLDVLGNPRDLLTDAGVRERDIACISGRVCRLIEIAHF